MIPYNVPPGGTVYIDRIEIFPSQSPVYSKSQLGGSYLDNFQALDSQTGPLDFTFFTTDPITNEFLFINTLYATSNGRTFGTNDSGWQRAGRLADQRNQ